jgi:hypothetical protein
MKFWEAVCAFREFETELEAVFCSERWRDTYGRDFLRFDEIVRNQERSILDGPLPVELTREIARRCDRMQFSFSPESGCLRLTSPALVADSRTITLSALDVHDRFGGSAIEEIVEKGSITVIDSTT